MINTKVVMRVYGIELTDVVERRVEKWLRKHTSMRKTMVEEVLTVSGIPRMTGGKGIQYRFITSAMADRLMKKWKGEGKIKLVYGRGWRSIWEWVKR